MSGHWEKKSHKRDWKSELLEVVHSEGYEPSTFRELRHLLNVPKDQNGALQDAVASLLELGRIRVGSRDRIHAVRERPTRQQRNDERNRERDLNREPRRVAKNGGLPQRHENAPVRTSEWTGPSWKQVQKLFADAHELPGPFAAVVREAVAKFGEPTDDDTRGREDCRGDEVCTIDPWNAHDHDDAVAVENLPQGGWRLDVHIADVSHYVTEASPIDKQAIKRSFTTYLPWTAVTMLPQTLAGNLCSLLEGKDRLALSCRMEIAPDGEIRDFRFFESVVRVRRFLSYEQAQELADKGDAALQRLKACSETMLERRKKENLLEFDLPEPKVVFDDKGEPVDARVEDRLPSHRWIEEAMLAANRCCARLLDDKSLPGLYRVHEPPEQESLLQISNWATSLELPKWTPSRRDEVEENNLRPRVQQWLGAILASGAIPTGLQGKIIRSMKKARYSPDCRGHFALGWLHYAHYTSPIRRYPDLWTHRVIKEHLRSQQVPARWSPSVRKLASHVSGREDSVVKAERSGNKCCAAWILRERLGEEFTATVTGVEAVGLFVQISSPWAEGMVHVRRMTDDFYEYNEERMELCGRRSGKEYRLGDVIQVRLAQADPVQGWVDFEPILLDEEGLPIPVRPGASRRMDISKGKIEHAQGRRSPKPGKSGTSKGKGKGKGQR
ncbi:MAG TPA: VacB/RNase II family 3'-5' exoribonuclease [Fibrobacteria bacterium]|nr:VacB/RNase II family 3'-5' exoribonuclease [Fibrobacteria bacterium]HOX50365.1 VacB/RNase II family 3'-5' exoribonuclease [Fibrobacteria bacterium]